jgi:hypothetical protein
VPAGSGRPPHSSVRGRACSRQMQWCGPGWSLPSASGSGRSLPRRM